MGGISDLLSSTLESIGSVKRVVKTVTSGYTLKATTVDDDGSIISPGTQPDRPIETKTSVDAFKLAQDAKSAVKLSDKSITSAGLKTPITTSSQSSADLNAKMNDALRLNDPIDLDVYGTGTPEGRANLIDADDITPQGESSTQSTVIDVSYPFSKNLEELAGDGVSTVQTSRDLGNITRRDISVISKIIVMPSWDNEFRAQVNKQNYDEIVWSTSDFILQNVSEQDAEKYQIIETFEDNLIYFYGRRPRVFNFSGQFLNSEEHQHKNNFIFEYASRLRGTKCVENKTRAFVLYEDNIVEGYILNISVSTSSEDAKACPFNFSMYVTGTTLINLSEVQDALNANANEVGLRNVIDNYKRANHIMRLSRKDSTEIRST